MKFLGNIIWLICGGLLTAVEYLISSLLLMVTIIGIPFGLQTLKLGMLALWPFGSRVTDNGKGIPPEELPLIFDRFHKSDKSRSVDREGVGLGLYLANGIITRQKGYISVKSKVGEGTTFSAYLLS